MTSGFPAKRSARSVPGPTWGEDVEVGRAMCTELRCSASFPNAFERCTRRAGPPKERWKSCRRVLSRSASSGKALWGSGICCEAPQLVTQWVGLAKVEVAGCAAARVVESAKTTIRNEMKRRVFADLHGMHDAKEAVALKSPVIAADLGCH